MFRSGRLKEHTTHTIEDSLKILECGVAALKKETIHYKNASLETFKKLKVYSVHVIKTQVTLCEMSLSDKDHWKFVEKRSATLPTDWDDRLGLIQYLELLATLFVYIKNVNMEIYHNRNTNRLYMFLGRCSIHPAYPKRTSKRKPWSSQLQLSYC
jgi:hypothetical protein